MSEPIRLKDNTQYRYTPDAGTVEGPVLCGVCGTQMDEKRACNGPRTFFEAMGKSKSNYDSFTCPVSEENWHVQAVKLNKAAGDTCSATLKKIYEEEAAEVVKTRKPSIDKVFYPMF